MKYIGIKFVDAVPMTAYDAMDCGYCNSDDDSDGYEINDGRFKYWHSKEEFEKDYNEIKNKELAETAKLMVSSDYKDRFRAECIQLENRYEGLKKMVESWDNGTLPFTPTCPREIYDEQLAAMRAYMKVLNERAHIENIPIYDGKTV